jgi:hypothetical protein
LAKKRRQKTEKKEELDIKLPEFDEHEYITSELRKIKMSFLAFIWALVMVVITFMLYTVTVPDWRGPIVLGLIGVVALPFIANIVKMDTEDFEMKNWAGSGAIYILSWLAIFILVCNPPFSDFAEPEIEVEEFAYFRINAEPDNWTTFNPDVDVPLLISPVKIRFRVKVLDNTEIDDDSILIKIEPAIIPNSTKTTFEMNAIGDDIYEAIITTGSPDLIFINNQFTYSIEGKDVNGHKKIIEGNFRVESVSL